jgi:hypothetical protein
MAVGGGLAEELPAEDQLLGSMLKWFWPIPPWRPKNLGAKPTRLARARAFAKAHLGVFGVEPKFLVATPKSAPAHALRGQTYWVLSNPTRTIRNLDLDWFNRTKDHSQDGTPLTVWGETIAYISDVSDNGSIVGAYVNSSPYWSYFPDGLFVEQEIGAPPPTASVNEAQLREALGLVGRDNVAVSFLDRDAHWFRFFPSRRIEPRERSGSRHGQSAMDSFASLPLPSLESYYQVGSYYVVREVSFSVQVGDGPQENWIALLHRRPAEVNCLFLRRRSAHAAFDAFVYLKDPASKQSGGKPGPGGSVSALHAVRDRVTVDVETGKDVVSLQNARVTLKDPVSMEQDLPEIPPPCGHLRFPVHGSERGAKRRVRDDFGAVSAFYHSDNVFQWMERFGFRDKHRDYFRGTVVPVAVQPMANFGAGYSGQGAVNAQAVANERSDGLGRIEFGRAHAERHVGIAADPRVVWHEFCHGLMFEALHDKTLKFAHSAGDAMAAIMSDPSSKANDRFLTFPWVKMVPPRRHDRRAADGWGWYGSRFQPFTGADPEGYVAEQILSTTLFNLYRILGGDSTYGSTRRPAALYVAYLIIGAIGLHAPVRNFDDVSPVSAAELFQYLMGVMDRYTDEFAPPGEPRLHGGTAHKVVRWVFEQQGLFQPEAPEWPRNEAGEPPIVDVYFDNGRGGGYRFDPRYADAPPGLWVRRRPDGIEKHQHARKGADNYVYVKVGNRGMGQAVIDQLRCHVAKETASPSWPGRFVGLKQHASAPVLPIGLAGRQSPTVMGPFVWRPRAAGKFHLIADVSSLNPDAFSPIETFDYSNIDKRSGLKCAKGSAKNGTPLDRLVPFDNNLALRLVSAD